MTPKEKAIYLYLMFKQRTYYVEVFHTIQLLDKFHNNAKDCALIAVDQIIKTMSAELGDPIEYWEKVKKEIEAL